MSEVFFRSIVVAWTGNVVVALVYELCLRLNVSVVTSLSQTMEPEKTEQCM